MRKKPHLSVVIPCYNEEKNLERGVLDQVDRFLRKQSYASEVIVSDDGSTDGSAAFVKKYLKKHPRFRLLENKHGGKAFAVRSGVRKARGELLLFTDMDQSTPLDQLNKLLPFFDQGYDVVIGSRGQGRKGFSPVRVTASAVFRIFRQILLLPNIVDTQCGFKVFKTKVVRDLFSRLMIFKNLTEIKGWRVSAFDVELLFIAQKRGYRTAEVPVNWKERDAAIEVKKKRQKFIKESRDMLKEILRVKLNDFKGLYD